MALQPWEFEEYLRARARAEEEDRIFRQRIKPRFDEWRPKPEPPKQLVKSPTGRVLVCFIGGPLHLTEKEYPDTEFKDARHRFLMPFPPMRPNEHPSFYLGEPLQAEVYTYNLGLTPSTLTSFSTHPIIVALFDSA